MRKRLAVGAVYVAVLAALVGATSAYAGLDKTVHISVDGKITNVHSYAGSVGAVLTRAGISVGNHDALTPSASSAVHDGSTITIERGRQIELTVDGSTREVWVTATSVEQALAQAGLRTRGAVITADRSGRVPLSGMAVVVDLPHTITVSVDGGSHVLVSAKTTLADALAEAGIVVGPADKVVSSDVVAGGLLPGAGGSLDALLAAPNLALDTRPTDGLNVTIVRISSQQAQVPEAIPFTTVTRNDATLLVGTKKVAQAGRNGTLVSTFQLGIADGKQISKTLVSKQITQAPVPQIVVIGTKPKPKPVPRIYPTKPDGLNWAALANCESGGRPNAVHGAFYGMYQFRISTWHAVGGSGLPSDASASEQTYRAQLLYSRSNWRTQWPTCGHLLFN